MKPTRHLVVGFVFGAVALTFVAPVAQHHPSPLAEADSTYVKTNYTKSEHMIPMRDGVKLFTAVYVPKDQSVPYPILLQRTPYSVRPYGVHHYADPPEHRMRYYAREGFIFVYQDVRGRYGSKGEFVPVRPYRKRKGPWQVDESTEHLGHDRLACEARAEPQRKGGNDRHVLPGLLRHDGHHRRASCT